MLLDPNDPATWEASIALERARNAQARYDAQLPSEGAPHSGTLTYKYETPDQPYDLELTFLVGYRDGEYWCAGFVEGVIYFNKWGIELEPGDRKQKLIDWFASQLVNCEWLQRDIAARIERERE